MTNANTSNTDCRQGSETAREYRLLVWRGKAQDSHGDRRNQDNNMKMGNETAAIDVRGSGKAKCPVYRFMGKDGTQY